MTDVLKQFPRSHNRRMHDTDTILKAKAPFLLLITEPSTMSNMLAHLTPNIGINRPYLPQVIGQ